MVGRRIQPMAEARLLRVELRGHGGVLGPLAGKQEGHGRRLAGVLLPGDEPLRDAGAQGGRRAVPVLADQDPPPGESPAAELEGVGDVRQLLLRMGGQVERQVVGGGLESAGGPRAERQELPAPRRTRRLERRRLFEHHVGVRPAHAEGAHPGPARGIAGGPAGQAGVDIEGAAREIDLGARLPEVQARRDLAPLEGEHRLDQPGDTRGGVEVAEIGLDRAEGAEAGAVGARAKRLGEGGDLDGIAEAGAGAMGLDIGDRRGIDARRRMRRGDRLGLALDARSGEAHLERSVVVDRCSLDHGADRIAVGEGVGQPFEENGPHAAARDRAAAGGVESAGVTVGGRDTALLVEIPAPRLRGDGHTTRQSHVAAAAQQALAGQGHGHQGGGASGLDGDARPLEIQFVGDAQGEEVVPVAQ